MTNHGMCKSRQYRIWQNMKKRCLNSKNPDYPRYGGRGIKVCDEWMRFEGFWTDMHEGYDDNLTIDRINVNGNYCKGNCRWADRKTQENNRTDNHYLQYNGVTYTMKELSEATGKNYNSLKTRIKAGYSVDDALKPVEYEQISFRGVTKTVIEYAHEYGMTYHQLKKRLMRGWNVERALTQPLRKHS